MKLLSFERNGMAGFGATDTQGVFDLTGKVRGAATLRQLLDLDGIDEARTAIAGKAADFALSDCTLLPVIPDAAKVLFLAINFQGHAVESGRDVPKYPIMCHRHAQTMIGHGAPMLKPIVSDQLDYEGELAVIMGKRGGHISPENALDYVAGYTCFNDGSVRDWQRHSHRLGMGKNFRDTGALGPWMVTKDEITDPSKLQMMTHINGEEVQNTTIDQMIFSVQELISYASKAVDWLPGDVLATGTPDGVGGAMKPPRYLKAGDKMDVTIPGIGTLTNMVANEVR